MPRNATLRTFAWTFALLWEDSRNDPYDHSGDGHGDKKSAPHQSWLEYSIDNCAAASRICVVTRRFFLPQNGECGTPSSDRFSRLLLTRYCRMEFASPHDLVFGDWHSVVVPVGAFRRTRTLPFDVFPEPTGCTTIYLAAVPALSQLPLIERMGRKLLMDRSFPG